MANVEAPRSDIKQLQEELAREVALLPAALQSGDPGLLVDYLATVFNEEDGQIVLKEESPHESPETSMLWRVFAEELTADLSTPEAQSQLEAMQNAAGQARAEIAEVERTCLPKARLGPFGNRPGSGSGELKLVTCLACNKTLLAHRFTAHLGHCGRQASVPSPAPSRTSAKPASSGARAKSAGAAQKAKAKKRQARSVPLGKSNLSACNGEAALAANKAQPGIPVGRGADWAGVGEEAEAVPSLRFLVRHKRTEHPRKVRRISALPWQSPPQLPPQELAIAVPQQPPPAAQAAVPRGVASGRVGQPNRGSIPNPVSNLPSTPGQLVRPQGKMTNPIRMPVPNQQALAAGQLPGQQYTFVQGAASRPAMGVGGQPVPSRQPVQTGVHPARPGFSFPGPQLPTQRGNGVVTTALPPVRPSVARPLGAQPLLSHQAQMMQNLARGPTGQLLYRPGQLPAGYRPPPGSQPGLLPNATSRAPAGPAVAVGQPARRPAYAALGQATTAATQAVSRPMGQPGALRPAYSVAGLPAVAGGAGKPAQPSAARSVPLHLERRRAAAEAASAAAGKKLPTPVYSLAASREGPGFDMSEFTYPTRPPGSLHLLPGGQHPSQMTLPPGYPQNVRMVPRPTQTTSQAPRTAVSTSQAVPSSHGLAYIPGLGQVGQGFPGAGAYTGALGLGMGVLPQGTRGGTLPQLHPSAPASRVPGNAAAGSVSHGGSAAPAPYPMMGRNTLAMSGMPSLSSQAAAGGDSGQPSLSSLPGSSQSISAMPVRSQAGGIMEGGGPSLDSPDQDDALLYATPLNGFRDDWREDHSWMLQSPSQAHV